MCRSTSNSDSRGPEFAQRSSELIAKLMVLFGKGQDSLVGEFESPEQGFVAGSYARRGANGAVSLGGRRRVQLLEPFDNFWLRVHPGAGDAGTARELHNADSFVPPFGVGKDLCRAVCCRLGAFARVVDKGRGVVSAHRCPCGRDLAARQCMCPVRFEACR